MSKTYSYDVDVVAGDGYSSQHQVEDVVQFETSDRWVTFYAAAGEVLAVFAASAVVSIVKDVDSGKESAA